MGKINLSNMLWIVWHKNDDPSSDPFRWVGDHRSIHKYLIERDPNQFTVGRLPAETWLEWYEIYAIGELEDNNGDDDFQIEYPR